MGRGIAPAQLDRHIAHGRARIIKSRGVSQVRRKGLVCRVLRSTLEGLVPRLLRLNNNGRS